MDGKSICQELVFNHILPDVIPTRTIQIQVTIARTEVTRIHSNTSSTGFTFNVCLSAQ